MPKHTSSHKGPTSVDEKSKIPSELKLTENGFYCKVTALKSIDKINIFPKIESHINLMSEMDSAIQEFGNIAKIADEKLVAVGKVYLVKFKNDNKWYRAQILRINYEEEEAEILYIDYLNTEFVKIDEIYDCPRNFISYNLMNITVSIHGVKYNPNVEEITVYNELAKLFEGRTIYAKVIENGDGRLPKIDFYEKKNSRSVIYKKIIDNGLLFIPS